MMLDILICQLEQQLIGNMLDVQEEEDRKRMSLWRATECEVP